MNRHCKCKSRRKLRGVQIEWHIRGNYRDLSQETLFPILIDTHCHVLVKWQTRMVTWTQLWGGHGTTIDRPSLTRGHLRNGKKHTHFFASIATCNTLTKTHYAPNYTHSIDLFVIYPWLTLLFSCLVRIVINQKAVVFIPAIFCHSRSTLPLPFPVIFYTWIWKLLWTCA